MIINYKYITAFFTEHIQGVYLLSVKMYINPMKTVLIEKNVIIQICIIMEADIKTLILDQKDTFEGKTRALTRQFLIYWTTTKPQIIRILLLLNFLRQ